MQSLVRLLPRKDQEHEDAMTKKELSLQIEDTQRQEHLCRQSAKDTINVEKPEWYNDFVSKGAFINKSSRFEKLYKGSPLTDTSMIYDALVVFEGGIPSLVERQQLFPTVDYRLWALVERVKQGFDNVRKKIGEDRYQQLNQMIDNMCEVFEADPEGLDTKPGEWRLLVDEISEVVRRS
jgi:hypothetical protein